MRYPFLAALALLLALTGCQTTPRQTPCADFDCSGHGQCTLVATPAGPHPSCLCDAGFLPSPSGWLCLPATDGSLCAGVSCSGKGACASVQGKPRCVCEAGLVPGAPEGTTCVDPCAGVTCAGHGLCLLDAASQQGRCACDPGYQPTADGLSCRTASAPEANILTWVLTSVQNPDARLGRMSLDVSEQSSGRLQETLSFNYWVYSHLARLHYELDPGSNELLGLRFEELVVEGQARRSRIGQATVGQDALSLSYQRGGKVATQSIPLVGAAPIPMPGGFEYPGWGFGSFSPVFYLLLLKRYDASQQGTQEIEVFIPEAGLSSRVKVTAADSWTNARPVLDLPDYGIQVIYQNEIPQAIKLEEMGVVWSLIQSTPADLNLDPVPPGTPFLPTLPPLQSMVQSTLPLTSGDGTILEATLAQPTGESLVPRPAVLLVSDMRGLDRDTPYRRLPAAPLYQHLAAHLAAAGYASLRYDPRGQGKSGGDPTKLTLTALRADAQAALASLAGTPGVDPARLFLASYAQGSLIAIPLLSATAPAPRGYLALAPVLKEMDKVVVYGHISHLKAAKLSNYMINHQKEPLEQDLKAIAEGTLEESEWRGLPVALWQEMLAFDGSAPLTAFTGPVLALRGDQDMEVPLEQLTAIGDLATQARKGNLGAVSLAGVSHLFGEGTTLDLWESALLPLELTPQALTAITSWLDQN